ncbi:uncharacterized protein Bfra_011438sa [Botrytis fragariae]|uniref:2EXR domain-containing protein n=1 Tax=Botrytis fragariae TaxID=1964551 RepID=A0A8H6AY21_9HELO|nr:uncharacterized protein Bfra_011438sa [Botrytis fragariae]KAF5875676.1 hypothetical protein Bfra_011438sa [Botrytis fragariae]
MMEQHKRLVASERNINEVEDIKEIARIAMKNVPYRAKHSFKSKKILPRGPNNKFSKFTSLPPELRQTIWKAALLEGRHVLEDDWKDGRCHLLPSPEVSNSKNPLQLACRESHEVVQERYTFVFQPMSDEMTAQDPENITALNLLPLNPDKDIVHRYLLLKAKDIWAHEFWGLTPVKHLSLDGDYFYDSENDHDTLTYHDEMDAIECIEAACPNLEILTIRVEGHGFIRNLLGYDTRVDSDFIELNSSFFDHVAATISNGKNCPLWKIRRNEDLRDIYTKLAKLLDRTRGRNSEYWKRVNMRVVLLQKPVYDWAYRSMCKELSSLLGYVHGT